jgi:hypothetical protein
VTLSNEVECDEASVIAGHKGQPEVVKSKERTGRRRRLQGKAGRGTLAKERPPVFGMMQRGGQVMIKLLANVQQKTIEPLIKDTIMPGTRVYTDEYSIYARLCSWGYGHKSVNHGAPAHLKCPLAWTNLPLGMGHAMKPHVLFCTSQGFPFVVSLPAPLR